MDLINRIKVNLARISTIAFYTKCWENPMYISACGLQSVSVSHHLNRKNKSC